VQLTTRGALVLLGVLELFAVVAVLRIWRERGRSTGHRLAWTLVTLIPVFGLIAFAVLRDPPPPNGPTDRPAKRAWWDYDP
jgi:bacteriorhodopsin